MSFANTNDENPYSGVEESRSTENRRSKNEPKDSSPRESLDPRAIDIGDVNGPMVIFYGPRDVGKTVATMRLLHYIKNNKNCDYTFESGFRSDVEAQNAVNSFQEGMKDIRTKPPRTSNFNFLLLKITHKGRPLFNLLEAPGEHFFDPRNPTDLTYPMYLNQLFRSNDKKIFVLFVEENLLDSTAMREHYSNKISNLINMEIQPKRDRLVILFNKIDRNPELFQGGRVNEQAIKNKVYNVDSFQKMVNTIKNTRSLREVLFVPFYSGNFVTDARWNMSEELYPQMLWNAINRHLRKRWFF